MKQLIGILVLFLVLVGGFSYYKVYQVKEYPSVYDNAKRGSSVNIKKLVVGKNGDIDEDKIKLLTNHFEKSIKDEPYNLVVTRSTGYYGRQNLLSDTYLGTFKFLLEQIEKNNKEYDIN